MRLRMVPGRPWRRPAVSPPDRSMPATREMTLAFFDFLEAKLDERGFFRPAGKKPVMQRNLRNIFHRIGLTEQDVRTLWGAIVRLVEGRALKCRRGSGCGKRRRRVEKVQAEASTAKNIFVLINDVCDLDVRLRTRA